MSTVVVDMGGDLGKYINDSSKKIPESHLQSVCKIYNGNLTCRYICLGLNGFICMKKSPAKGELDRKVILSINGLIPLSEKMKALGDNCEGLGNED